VSEQKDLEAESRMIANLSGIKGARFKAGPLYKRFGLDLPDSIKPDDELGGDPEPPQLPAPDPGGLKLLNAPGNDQDPDDKQGQQGQPGKRGQFAEGGASFEAVRIAQQADADRERVIADPDLNQAVRDGFSDYLSGVRGWLGQFDSVKTAVEKSLPTPSQPSISPPGIPDSLVSAIASTVKLAYLRGLLQNAANLDFQGVPGTRQFGENPAGNLYHLHSGGELSFGDFESLDFAIDRVNKLNIFERPEFDQLDDWARSLALTAAGQTSTTIEDQIKAALLSALQDGNSINDVIDSLYPQWEPLPGFKGKDVPFLTEAHIENVVRTNSMRAYNQGWNDMAYADGMADLVPAAEFVAILDDRTTEICTEMHGRLLTRNEVGALTPPLHYQCRSVLVWLTKSQLANKPASSFITRSDVAKLPVKSQPLPGFGGYVPLFGGNG
jgi:SPP1 gp7 family putative phage head morphogenesis protein